MSKRGRFPWVIVLAAVIGGLALSAGSAEAAKGKKKNVAELYKKLDADRDGKVSAAEFAKIKELAPRIP
jgi:hypothetical protein